MTIQPGFIGITAHDLDASLAFYRLLGLAIPERAADQDHVDISTPNGYGIAWDSEVLIRKLYPDWVEPAGQRVTLAFRCDNPAAVDATCAKLAAAGYKVRREPWDAFWGQRYAVVV